MSDNVTPIRPESGPTAKDLRQAIEEMDSMSHQGFSQVAAIAGLVRKTIDAVIDSSSDDLRRADAMSIATAMDAISYLAENLGNGVNCIAENVGCNHKERPSA